MANPILPGTIQSAPSGLLGFDTNTVVSASVAKQFYADDYRFCVRYVGRTSQASNDLTYSEALDILNAGLGLMIVQHVSEWGWTPTSALGTEYGSNAALFAEEIGLPKGVNLWLDLEGVATGTSANTVGEYCNNWYEAVFEAGYVPGIYVGASAILSSIELYTALKFEHYWKSGSSVPPVATRGYQLIQKNLDITVNGIQIDQDMTQNDSLGGQVLWLINA